MAYSGAYGAGRAAPEETEVTPAADSPRPAGQPTPSRNAPRPRPSFDLGSLFAKTEAAGMETDDLLMALILYLMYRESGDTDLLIMLGVMLLT